MSDIYQFKVKSIDGSMIQLDRYRGKAMLIVNTASRCGYTPQYEGLEKMHQELQEQLVILGFPCNQFGAQEPGTEAEIQQFCDLKYHISFPMFAKVNVNGDDADPLYQYLTDKLPGILGSKAIKWNFTKFFIDQHGTPIKRYAPKDSPEEITREIKKYLVE